MVFAVVHYHQSDDSLLSPAELHADCTRALDTQAAQTDLMCRV